MVRNTILAVVSVIIVLFLTVAGDLVLGGLLPDSSPPGSMQLIFPPNSEQEYARLAFKYTVHTNSLGLREREITAKRPGTYRICAIGDSNTYGWGVEAEQTWLRRIETNLRDQGYDVETINLGKPGAHPASYAELAAKAVPSLRPDLVVVALLQGNDLHAAGLIEAEPLKHTVLDFLFTFYPNTTRVLRDMRRNRDFATRGQEIMPPTKSTAAENQRWTANTARAYYESMTPDQRTRFEALDSDVKTAFLEGLLNLSMVKWAMNSPLYYSLTLDLDDDWTATCIEHTAVQLSHIKKVCGQSGAAMVVLSIPEGGYVNDAALENLRRMGFEIPVTVLGSGAPDEGIRRATARVGVPFLSVTEVFWQRRMDPTLFFVLDGHLTPAAHELYGDAMTPLLREQIPDLPRR